MRKTIDISGMGGGYERLCQRMLWNGIGYLEAGGAKSDIVVGSYRDVTGIAWAESDNAKALDAAMMKGTEGATGAMHQAVLGHLQFIAHKGYDDWLGEFADDPGRIYEIDPTNIPD